VFFQLTQGLCYHHSAKRLWKNTDIPEGIAQTDVILENLLAICVCCDAKIPVVVKVSYTD